MPTINISFTNRENRQIMEAFSKQNRFITVQKYIKSLVTIGLSYSTLEDEREDTLEQ